MAIDLNLLSRLGLQTERGKALLEDTITELDILSKLGEYQNLLPEVDLSDLSDELSKELVSLYEKAGQTTREERKTNRELRRLERQRRREERQKSREQRLQERLEEARNLGVEGTDDIKTRIGAEIAILIQKLKDNTPTTTKYTITGKITDAVGNEPVKGAEIFLGVNPTPLGDKFKTSLKVEEADSPLSLEERDLLGNISFDAYKNLDRTTREQLAKELSIFRSETLNENKAKDEVDLIEVKITPKQLDEFLNNDEKYTEIAGVEIDINPNNYLYVPNKKFKNPNYNKDEPETPDNLKEITGNINDPTKNVVTDEDGFFTLNIYIPIIPSTQKCPVDIAILTRQGNVKGENGQYVDKKFLPGTFFLLNGDRTLKTELGVKEIVSTDDLSKILAIEFNQKVDDAQDAIFNLALAPLEKIVSLRKRSLNKITNEIKSKLIPLVISLLLAFGISKITDANRKTCPSREELDRIARRRNKVVRQLNNIWKTISVNTGIAAAFIYLATQLKGIRLALDALPIPQAVGTPPAKDFGGLIFAQPYSATAKLQRLNELLEELSKNNKDLNKAIIVNLVVLIAGTVTAIILLKLLDRLLEECYQAEGVTELELLEIQQELLDIAEEEEDDGNPKVESVNGFIFSVETDNKNIVGTLKRRFAVAKNAQGVTLLRGESSFSSSDQVLIDELIFYIQQNNLKAN